MAIEQPEKRQFQKRAPAKHVSVSALNKDLTRISLVGTVVSRNDAVMSFLLDDSSGTVNIIVNNADMFSPIKDGQIVRVLGRIWGEGADIEVQGDIVQDFSNLDFPQFRKVFSPQ
jgi:uncharacterized protein YdeI (BOF family)